MKTENLTLAYKLRHALDQNVVDLPPKIMERLAFSRKMAMQQKKPASATQRIAATRIAVAGYGASSPWDRGWGWMARMGLVLPFVVLAFGLMGIYQYERHQQLVEAAYIDAEVLSDELPLSAYLDNGFDAYLLNNNGSN